MYANWSESNWSNNSKRQLIAFEISLLLMVLILLIPIRLSFKNIQQEKSIEIEFSELIPEKEITKQPPESKEQAKPLKKPIQPRKIQKIIPVDLQTKNTVNPTEPFLSSAVIINSIRNRKVYTELDKDFQVRSESDGNFKFKTVKKSKVYQSQKYINEAIDKPQTPMRYKTDGNIVTTIKVIQGLLGGIYDNTEKQYIDCDLESQDIPDWQCK